MVECVFMVFMQSGEATLVEEGWEWDGRFVIYISIFPNCVQKHHLSFLAFVSTLVHRAGPGNFHPKASKWLR